MVELARRLVGDLRCRIFDWRHNVETCGEATPERSVVNGPTAEHGVGYSPSHVKFLKLLFGGLNIRHEDFTFIDLGSGKGRALLMAADHPFQRIIGVEYAEDLHRVSCENVKRYRSRSQRCRDITCIHRDVTEFEFPAGPLVVYMYNPFRPPVLVPVLQTLQASLERQRRDVVLVYSSPFYATEVERVTCLRCAEQARYHHTYRTPAVSAPAELWQVPSTQTPGIPMRVEGSTTASAERRSSRRPIERPISVPRTGDALPVRRLGIHVDSTPDSPSASGDHAF